MDAGMFLRRIKMNMVTRCVGVLAMGLCASVGHAQEVIDVSGMQSWGLDGDVLNELGVFATTQSGDPEIGGIVLGITYDLTIETFGSSWLSDVNIRFGNSDGTFHGAWPDTFTPGLGVDQGGVQRFTGSFATDFHLNADKEFHMTLFESFDDNPGFADAVFREGSTITLEYFIPAPTTSAMLGMGLLCATRRRR
tara:strand:+ start:26546 stop:27127 length:582 start_codon:yes stop_codon:yes gene_type:complete